MYKYLCVISDNADKKDFFNTVEDVKNCYPDCRDAPEADINCLRRIISVTEENIEKNICIRYDFSNKKISVLSDIYLDKFFKGKEIENISGYPADLSKTLRIILSVIFAALNFSSLLLIAGIVEFRLWIIYSALAVIYIISAFIIKNKREINEFKILFIQFGGYITIAVLLIALFSNSWTGAAIIWCFFIAVIPALILSLIIRLIIKAVKNKN